VERDAEDLMMTAKLIDVAAAAGGEALAEKAANLLEILKSLSPVVVAFSGGVDSTLLLAAVREACGDGVIAVTASSATYPRRELAAAERLAASLGARHRVIKTREMDDPAFTANPPERCYHCKRELFRELGRLAAAEGCRAVVEGSNVDDLGDFRPGERAGREAGAASPLRQAALTKADIRALARALGLPNWDKPAAACLASRFPYGTSITRESLERIERIEDALGDLGFGQVRARSHGDLIRLEVAPSSLAAAAAPAVRDRIVQVVKREGYRFVALDLQGYRTGSFNP
jgi:uncharacterized protein